MNRYEGSMRSAAPVARAAFFAALLIMFPAVSASAEEKPAADSAADFEAALFAGSGDSSGTDAGGDAAGTDNKAAGSNAAGNGFAAVSASSETARVEYLAGGTVIGKAAASVASGADRYSALADVRGRLFAKVAVPDYGALFIAYNASYPFFQGYAGNGTAPAAADTAAPDYALAELHYSFDIGKKLFVRLGNQLIAWGPSRVWTPVDFINRQKADSFAEVESRVGKNGLRLHLPLQSSNLFFFADFSEMTANGSYGDPLGTVNLGGRFDFVFGPFEFGLTGYGGRNAQARAGVDFSGRALGTTLYGEAAFEPGYGSYSSGVQASFGLSRTLDELKRWTLSAEGFYNSRGENRTGLSAISVTALPDSEKPIPLYQGAFYAYAALTTTELGSTFVSGTLSAIANLQDFSYSVKLAPSFDFPRAVPFTVALAYSGGGADKEFTRFAGNGTVSVTISTKIDF